MFETGKSRLDVSLKKIEKWPVSTQQAAQHHRSVGKCKLKLQRGTPFKPLGMAMIRRADNSSRGNRCSRTWPLCMAGGDANAVATVGSRSASSEKVNHTLTTWPSNCTPRNRHGKWKHVHTKTWVRTLPAAWLTAVGVDTAYVSLTLLLMDK